MNESRNFPLYLPVSHTPPQLQVRAEGSGGGGPGLREALERGYVTRAHIRKVGKEKGEKSPQLSQLGGMLWSFKYFDQKGQLHMGTKLGKGPSLLHLPRNPSGAPDSRGVVSTGSYCRAERLRTD